MEREREFFFNDLLVRIHFIAELIYQKQEPSSDNSVLRVGFEGQALGIRQPAARLARPRKRPTFVKKKKAGMIDDRPQETPHEMARSKS